MQANFDPLDTAGLSSAFRSKPVSDGVIAVCRGGRRPDRCFVADLMAGELGLPLVHAAVPVTGCLAFVDPYPPRPGGSATAASGGSALSPASVAGMIASSVGAVTAAAGGGGSGMVIPRPGPGTAVVLSVNVPAPDLERAADLVILFSGAGRPDCTPPPAPARTPTDDRIDARSNFNVAIGGRSYGFSEVSRVSCDAHGARGTVYPNLVLRRAVTLNRDLYEWRMNIVNGQADVRSVAIHHLSPAMDAVRTWFIEGAWPVRWSGPAFDSMAAQPAMEEIEIRITGFTWI